MMCASRVVSERASANERGEVLLKMLAPGSQMAALIGPKGSTIRQVSMDTSARLAVLPYDMMNASR